MYLVERKNNVLRPDILIVKTIKMAKKIAGSTNDKANIFAFGEGLVGGFLQLRLNGFDIDYGNMISSVKLPTNKITGFLHNRNKKPWTLLKRAYWYDDKKMPTIIKEYGVKFLKNKKHIASLIDDLIDYKYKDKNYEYNFILEWEIYDIKKLIAEFEDTKNKIIHDKSTGYIFTKKISSKIEEVKNILGYDSKIHIYTIMKVFYQPLFFNFVIPLKDKNQNKNKVYIGDIIAIKKKIK